MIDLNRVQLAALVSLAKDPASNKSAIGYIESGTKAFLRRNGLVGHAITDKGIRGKQKTTSPITPKGSDELRARGLA